jgi:thiamine-phosphate pyrophosphorylase
MLNRLHYISQGETAEAQEKDILDALEAGCKLIQLRFKKGTLEEVEILARKAKLWCENHGAKLIINDLVEIASKVDADGVHLGLTDTNIEEARKVLGPTKIIGGTANTLQDVLQRIDERVDYIGLGPYRFTTTKEKLSPILGLEGYQHIENELRSRDLSVSIYAIGGIEVEDIEQIRNTGIYGVAVSGIISNSTEKAQTVREIEKRLC